MEYIKKHVRDVIDFPQKGVVFKDLTTVFKDPRALHIIGWDLAQLYRDKGVTKVVGIESRGFIGASILSFELGAGFVPVRKPGKLPADTISASYDKEYGKDTIEFRHFFFSFLAWSFFTGLEMEEEKSQACVCTYRSEEE